MLGEEKILDLLLAKFVNEEIMTKSEFQLSIDRIMDRHEASIDAKFRLFDNKLERMEAHFDRQFLKIDNQFLKIDGRYNWIVGIAIASTIGIMGMGLKIISMIPH